MGIGVVEPIVDDHLEVESAARCTRWSTSHPAASTLARSGEGLPGDHRHLPGRVKRHHSGVSSSGHGYPACAFTPRLVEQPGRPDDLGVSRADPLCQSPVGRDHDHLAVRVANRRVCRRRRRPHAQPRRRSTTASSAPARARPSSTRVTAGVEPSGRHRCPTRSVKRGAAAWPVAPPAGSPRPDHVGGIDHEHPNIVAAVQSPLEKFKAGATAQVGPLSNHFTDDRDPGPGSPISPRIRLDVSWASRFTVKV